MCFFKKKRAAKKATKLENEIRVNAKDVKQIAGITDSIVAGFKRTNIAPEDLKQIIKSLDDIKVKIMFFNPTTDKEVLKIDHEIEKYLNEIKSEVELAIVKGDDVKEKALTKIVQIEMLIPERKRLSEY